jgi:hypothetical protein
MIVASHVALIVGLSNQHRELRHYFRSRSLAALRMLPVA